MKLLIKLCVVIALLTSMVYAGTPYLVKQRVKWYAAENLGSQYANNQGVQFWYWNKRLLLLDNNDYQSQADPWNTVSYTASIHANTWTTDEGNFDAPDPGWITGDTSFCLGGWDPKYVDDPVGYNANPEHVGYWFGFSDTVGASATGTQIWKQDDTLRLMAQPIASFVAPNVTVQIPNPYESDHAPWGAFAYDVMGYWLVGSKTDGSPGSMVNIGYYPISGAAGDMTFCVYNPATYFGGGNYTVYNAYYIVFRPDTTPPAGVCPGFKTPFMSQNSPGEPITGIAEDDKTPTACAVFTAPLFRNSTAIRYTLPTQTHVSLSVYNPMGQLVKTLVDGVKAAGEHSVTFDANALSSGVYFYRFETAEKTISGKLTAIR